MLGCIAFLWVDGSIDAKQTGIARRVGKRRYAERQTRLFANAPVQPRAAPVAQNGREQVERRYIGTRDLWNVPREGEVRQFCGKFLVYFSPAKLRRLRRNEYRLERFLRIRLEQFRQLLPHFFRINISYHHECEIVRDVPRFVILHHLLLRELIVNFELPDNRESIRMTLVSGCKKEQPGHAIRIIHAHRKFAPDDFLLFLIFCRRQGGIHRCVSQNLESGGDAIFRHVDPKNSAIERRIRVDVTPHVLNFLGDLIGPSGFRPFEQHVLENM